MADADDPDLRARVEQLEATVEAQQETIQQLLPSRRRVLQAGGLVAGGGVLGALSADRASADVTGQVGTQQDRVDVFAGAVDANSVNTATLGVGGQPEINDFPPVVTFNRDIADSAPPTSYTTDTLTSAGSDASWALISIQAEGDGTADLAQLRVREAGSTRKFDIEALGWAGNAAFTVGEKGWVPLNADQQIEYKSNLANISRVNIYTHGYI